MTGTNVVFVGTGAIGLPMAVRLAGTGHHGHRGGSGAGRPDRAAAAGVPTVGRFTDAPAAAIVVVMVATPDQLAGLVTEALRGPGAASAGS